MKQLYLILFLLAFTNVEAVRNRRPPTRTPARVRTQPEGPAARILPSLTSNGTFDLNRIFNKKNIKPMALILAGYAILTGINENRRTKRIVREVSDELTKTVSRAIQNYVQE